MKTINIFKLLVLTLTIVGLNMAHLKVKRANEVCCLDKSNYSYNWTESCTGTLVGKANSIDKCKKAYNIVLDNIEFKTGKKQAYVEAINAGTFKPIDKNDLQLDNQVPKMITGISCCLSSSGNSEYFFHQSPDCKENSKTVGTKAPSAKECIEKVSV